MPTAAPLRQRGPGRHRKLSPPEPKMPSQLFSFLFLTLKASRCPPLAVPRPCLCCPRCSRPAAQELYGVPQAEGPWQLSTWQQQETRREKSPGSPDLLPRPSLGCSQRGSGGSCGKGLAFLAGVALESEAAPELEHSNSSHGLGRGAAELGNFGRRLPSILQGKAVAAVSTWGQVKRFSFFSLFSALSKIISAMG